MGLTVTYQQTLVTDGREFLQQFWWRTVLKLLVVSWVQRNQVIGMCRNHHNSNPCKQNQKLISVARCVREKKKRFHEAFSVEQISP